MTFTRDVAVVGGCGHVGLPLAVSLADTGLNVVIYDTSQQGVSSVNSGVAPFMEDGISEPLSRVVRNGRLIATTEPEFTSTAEHVIVVIGTPVDSHGNPDHGNVRRCLTDLLPHLRDGQLLVLRSTVYPGTTRWVEDTLKSVASLGHGIDVAYCPERITEGNAMRELRELPQVVSGDRRARERAACLFDNLIPPGQVIEYRCFEEAELAKLLTNAWRYIQFAAANEFWRIATEHGLDYGDIRAGMMRGYPRNATLPTAGLAAGPCLVKDTQQLRALDAGNFQLGSAALSVNEGLPLVIIERLQRKFRLEGKTVGICGMAFKGGSDDTRGSLAYKLRDALRFEVGPEGRVMCTDPYVTTDPDLVSLDTVLDNSDIIIVGAPHEAYRRHLATLWTDPETLVDVWGITQTGTGI